MATKRKLEQHIAVFGESGSGKTVLLSSFFGPTQEHGYGDRNLFDVVANDSGQGARLFQNYLGMRNSARVPEPNKFESISYAFSVKKARGLPSNSKKKPPVDEVRLVWHDYPGEWFTQQVEGEEAARRVNGFNALLGSDVAVLLVDAQLLLDNEGQEEAYLKSLFWNYRAGLESLRVKISSDGEPLVVFPRIWIVALSKSDLMPDIDVQMFKELITEKSAGDLDSLRKLIAGMVAAPEALSVGEDFLLLSSAKFRPGEIEVAERVGVDLLLPIAAVLPFERHANWVRTLQLPHQVAEHLLNNAGRIAAVLTLVAPFVKKLKLPGPIGALGVLLASFLSKEAIDKVLDVGRVKLEEVKAEALARQDYLTAVLTRFRIDLEDAERAKVLIRSRK